MKQDYRISYLRALACIAIVILHTFYIANITFTDSYGLFRNILSNTARNLMLWAVPNFVMITGALLLDPEKQITIRKIFTKYIKRVFLALLIFCIVYQVFDSIAIDKNFGISSILTGIKETLLGTSWSTMWYPYTLISLYLLLPFYRIIAAKASQGEMRYLLFIYALFLSIFPILRIWDIRLGFTISVASIYPFYLFMGHAIYTGIIKITKQAALIMIIAGSILTIFLTSLRYAQDIEALEMFRDYNGINVLIQSIGVFAYFFSEGGGFALPGASPNQTPEKSRGSKGKGQLIHNILLSIDDNSFGIYLIHIIFIKWVFRVISFNPYTHGSIFAFVLIIGLITLISWGITWVLKKIPGIKSIL